jgi:leader peptidase (prepilin peptidase) / N-methyltransferase
VAAASSKAPAADATPWRRRAVLIAATVIAAAVVALVQDSVTNSVLRALMVLVAVPCAAIDLERRIIPNRITGPGAVIALAAGLALDPGGEPSRLAWTAGVAGFLLVASLVNPAGMGMGDVKLLGVMGLCLGRPVIVALAAALLASVLTGFAIATRRGVRAARKTALPFGPYLTFGGLLAAVAGDPTIHAYLHLHH